MSSTTPSTTSWPHSPTTAATDAPVLRSVLSSPHRDLSPTQGPRAPGDPTVGTTPDRSHTRIALGQQLYAVLEQCRKPEVLWAKLARGNHDRLGVRRLGRYVLGRPRLSAVVP